MVLAAAVAIVIAGTVAAVAARSGTSRAAAEAARRRAPRRDRRPPPAGVTARVTFTNNLFPSGALFGNAGSALISGASGRLWLTDDGRGRIELQSDAGDVQIVWSPTKVTVFDASSNTVYKLSLPASTASGRRTRTRRRRSRRSRTS